MNPKSETELSKREFGRLQNLLANKEAAIKRMNRRIVSIENENKDLLMQLKDERVKWQNSYEKLAYWKKRSTEQAQDLEYLETKYQNQSQTVEELRTEVKWHKGKVRILEKTVEKSNQTRLESQQANREKVKELTKTKVELEIELQKLLTKQGDDECFIQNIQNAMRQLQTENERFRIKCGESLTGVNSLANYTPPLSNRERTGRSALLPTPDVANVNPINMAARRDFHCRRNGEKQAEVGNWPYSKVDEDIFFFGW